MTINTTVLVPTTTKVWVGPAIGQGPWVIAWPWGHPDMIPVHQLTPASSFALEKLYLYHYLPAQEHPGGWVINATPQGLIISQ